MINAVEMYRDRFGRYWKRFPKRPEYVWNGLVGWGLFLDGHGLVLLQSKS
jgi:hypothetical protein